MQLVMGPPRDCEGLGERHKVNIWLVRGGLGLGKVAGLFPSVAQGAMLNASMGYS